MPPGQPPWGAARGVLQPHSWPVPTTNHLPCSPSVTDTQIPTRLPHRSLPFHPVSLAAARLPGERHMPSSNYPITRASQGPALPTSHNSQATAFPSPPPNSQLEFQKHMAVCVAPVHSCLRAHSHRLDSPKEGLCLSR